MFSHNVSAGNTGSSHAAIRHPASLTLWHTLISELQRMTRHIAGPKLALLCTLWTSIHVYHGEDV